MEVFFSQYAEVLFGERYQNSWRADEYETKGISLIISEWLEFLRKILLFSLVEMERTETSPYFASYNLILLSFFIRKDLRLRAAFKSTMKTKRNCFALRDFP